MQTLMQEGVITARIVVLDSYPIPANVKENDLKASVKDRFNKNHWPKGDPEASLAIMVHYPRSFKEKICYFWGYRNHTIIDAETELSLGEETLPADRSEIRQTIPIFKELIERHPFLRIEAILLDYGRKITEPKKKAADLQLRVRRQYEAIESGKIDLSLVAERLKELRIQRDSLQEEIAYYERLNSQYQPFYITRPMIESYRKKMEEVLVGINVQEQRNFLKKFIEKIIVKMVGNYH